MNRLKIVACIFVVGVLITAALLGFVYFIPSRDVVEEKYETYADAVNRNALEHGMIPDFLPKSASRIISIRNIDLNIYSCEFSYGDDFSDFLSSQITKRFTGKQIIRIPEGSDIDLTHLESVIYVPRVNTPDEYSQGVLVINTSQHRALFYFEPARTDGGG